MSPPDVWLVRHAETAWTEERRHTGRTDLPLTPRGENEARELRGRLPDLAFDLVISSPLRRARQTGELAGYEPEIDTRLLEWDYGSYEGRTTDEIRLERPGWDLWRDGCPGGERLDEVAARAALLGNDLRARAGERLLVFSHGHVLRVFTACWLELDATAARNFELETAAVCALSSEHGWPTIARWNLR
jgi:broad specificity phosphatase PhoE